jgi:heptaprenylglyceryl phosphate synthase
MVRSVRKSVKIPLIVGGGVNTPEKALQVTRAGADIIVTGTLVENGDFERPLRAVIDTVHGA